MQRTWCPAHSFESCGIAWAAWPRTEGLHDDPSNAMTGPSGPDGDADPQPANAGLDARRAGAATSGPAALGSTRSDVDAFSSRVLTYFTTQAVTAALGIFNGFFLARAIGPEGKGEYYLLTFLPPSLMVLSQLGLPQAFGFYSARGQTRHLIRQSLVLTATIALPILVLTIALLPVLRGSILRGLEPIAIIVPLSAMPLLLHATFTTGIVVGRQA